MGQVRRILHVTAVRAQFECLLSILKNGAFVGDILNGLHRASPSETQERLAQVHLHGSDCHQEPMPSSAQFFDHEKGGQHHQGVLQPHLLPSQPTQDGATGEYFSWEPCIFPQSQLFFPISKFFCAPLACTFSTCQTNL